jgi:hypothetical protein
MNPPPSLFILFCFLSSVFLVIRNIYFIRVWQQRNNINNDLIYKKIFRNGVEKFMLPISTNNEIKNVQLNKEINSLNLFNYMALLSFILSVISFCFS